jgi:hypothetical protein
MSIQLHSPAEAFLAIAAVAIGADGVGSMSERDFLYKHVKSMDALKGVEPAEFDKLLGSVIDRVYAALPQENMAITTAGVQMLVAAARSVLSPEQQKAAVKMATELCAADGESPSETVLIQELERGFAAR